jgi:tetratricopeptide (TPR) repeat protein
MTSPTSNAITRDLKGCLAVLLVFVASCAHAQTTESSGQNPKQPPAFSPAGVQGSTAPAGYSTGLSREETSEVSQGFHDLNHEPLSSFVPDRFETDCRREPELVKAAEADSKSFEANHAAGIFYLGHGEFSRSLAYLEAARLAKPSDIHNSRALALTLLGVRRNTEAIAILENMSASAKNDPASLKLLALAYLLSGNRQKSAEIYQRAALEDSEADNQFDCGLGLIRAGAPEIAVRVFRSATIAHPDQANLWLGLGIVQSLSHQKIEAIQSLLRAVSLDPDYVPPYYFLAGLADASPERATEIRQRLAGFAVAHPNRADAHYDYALALWKQQRANPEKASTSEIESQLKLALALDPNMAPAHLQLGIVFAEMNDFSSAEHELLRAVQLEPKNATAHYRLAQACERIHKPELANEEMRRFRALRDTEQADENDVGPGLWTPGEDLTSLILFAPPCNRKP